jgi:uncharacterized membrane protein YhaH (DUF805 family)
MIPRIPGQVAQNPRQGEGEMDWYVVAMRNYVGFDGRSHRRAYWSFLALLTLASVLVGAIFGIAGPRSANLAGALFTLIHLLPALAAASRRLHDVGLSGWWQLVAFVPVLGLLVLVVMLAWPGKLGGNAYGPPPTDKPEE